MKQQEILKKISNILKELNEQHEYLLAGESHLNDLELELFAANAKFLTDHTEILRKINLQNQQMNLALPEHTEPAQLHANPDAPEQTSSGLPSLDETTLPPLAENAVTYYPVNTDNDYDTAEQEQPLAIKQPDEQQQPEPAPEYSINPVVPDEPEPQINIQPAKEYDSYGFVRTQPQVSNEQRSFSISTHTQDEPTPEHVDLSVPAQPETTAEKPAEEEATLFAPETHEPDTTQPVHTPPEPAQEVKPFFAPQTYEPAPTAPEQPHTPQPAAEAPKPQPEQPLTLNERLSAQLRGGNNTAAQPQQQQAVSDIKSVISLNDKLLFVKDLFNGYSLAYSEAIELLNRCKTFDEADRFLKSNYVAKNNWTDKPATVDKFYAILHRRFTA